MAAHATKFQDYGESFPCGGAKQMYCLDLSVEPLKSPTG